MSYWKIVSYACTSGLTRKLRSKTLSYDKSTHILTTSHLPLAVFVRGQQLRIERYDFFRIRKDPLKQVLHSTEYEFSFGHWTSAILDPKSTRPIPSKRLGQTGELPGLEELTATEDNKLNWETLPSWLDLPSNFPKQSSDRS